MCAVGGECAGAKAQAGRHGRAEPQVSGAQRSMPENHRGRVPKNVSDLYWASSDGAQWQRRPWPHHLQEAVAPSPLPMPAAVRHGTRGLANPKECSCDVSSTWGETSAGHFRVQTGCAGRECQPVVPSPRLTLGQDTRHQPRSGTRTRSWPPRKRQRAGTCLRPENTAPHCPGGRVGQARRPYEILDSIHARALIDVPRGSGWTRWRTIALIPDIWSRISADVCSYAPFGIAEKNGRSGFRLEAQIGEAPRGKELRGLRQTEDWPRPGPPGHRSGDDQRPPALALAIRLRDKRGGHVWVVRFMMMRADRALLAGMPAGCRSYRFSTFLVGHVAARDKRNLAGRPSGYAITEGSRILSEANPASTYS